jgi:hypothetical protein
MAHDADRDASTWFSGHAPERALDMASAIPTGRILPSLVETAPGGLSATESKLRKRPSRQGSAEDKIKGKVIGAQSASGRRSRVPLGGKDLVASLQGSFEAAPDDSVQARSGQGLVLNTAEQVETPAAERPHRRGRRAKTHTSPVNIFASACNAQPASSSILADVDVSRKRHQFILARYVFGTEPKLGERWKRRLRRP